MSNPPLDQENSLADLSPEKMTVAQAALKALRAADGPLLGFVQLLGVRFESFGDGQAQSSLAVEPHVLNPLGIAHGGATFTLADTTCGLAALSTMAQPAIVTQDMQIRYHGPARPGRLDCTAEVVHKGSRTITTQARITQGEVLVATVTGTFAILNSAERSNLAE